VESVAFTSGAGLRIEQQTSGTMNSCSWRRSKHLMVGKVLCTLRWIGLKPAIFRRQSNDKLLRKVHY